MDDKHHIFLSYSRKDGEIMQRVKDTFQSESFKVWTDEGIEPGTPLWTDEIEKAIENSECVVVMLTPDAKNSIWVKRELEYAGMQKKQVFPLLARGDESSSIPFALSGAQYVDIRSNETIGILKLILTLKQRFDISIDSKLVDATSKHKTIQLASSLIRSVQEQGSYISLNEIIAVLDRTKYEIQSVYSRLEKIANDQGYITYEDITTNLPADMNEPEIIDEITRRLRGEKIGIIEGEVLVRIQVLTKAAKKGFVTYDDILNWIEINIDEPDRALLDDINDDLLEAGIQVFSGNEDVLYQEAVEYVQQMNKASTSMLQRRFRIGYERAKAIINMMEERGVVGPSEGGWPRKILGD